MNKKRDALRRGIRDLIADTTRELAAFEGRTPERHLASEPALGDESGPAHRDPRSPGEDFQSAALPHDVTALNGSAVSPDTDRTGADGDGSLDAGSADVTDAPPAQHVAPAAAFELVTDAVFFPSATPAESGGRVTPKPGSRRQKPEVSKSAPARSQPRR